MVKFQISCISGKFSEYGIPFDFTNIHRIQHNFWLINGYLKYDAPLM